MKNYDVLNDYSLASTEAPQTGTVIWKAKEINVNGETISVEFGYSRKHNELVYLRTNSETDLNGKHLF